MRSGYVITCRAASQREGEPPFEGGSPPDSRVVLAACGCCECEREGALIRRGSGEVELTKMAVKPELRGAGIGRKLIEVALDAFKEMGDRELFLETNTRLAPAIKLYESVGFRHHPTTRPDSHFQRANVCMVWQPKPAD